MAEKAVPMNPAFGMIIGIALYRMANEAVRMPEPTRKRTMLWAFSFVSVSPILFSLLILSVSFFNNFVFFGVVSCVSDQNEEPNRGGRRRRRRVCVLVWLRKKKKKSQSRFFFRVSFFCDQLGRAKATTPPSQVPHSRSLFAASL